MSASSFPSYGNVRSMIELWVVITVVLVIAAGAACLGQLGWGCSTWVMGASAIWLGVSVVIAACLGGGSLVSGRPGE